MHFTVAVDDKIYLVVIQSQECNGKISGKLQSEPSTWMRK